jgi:DNA-binding IclR family transcriptional regulator
MAIIGALVSHRPNPVSVGIISAELGMERSIASRHLAKLRKVRLVGMQGRKRGYVADSAEIRAVIGGENYTRITQGFFRQNEDTPGLS